MILHPFDAGVVSEMLEIVSNSSLDGRDAVHAATARRAGFDHIVTADGDFDRVPGLARVSPEEALALLGH